MDILTSLTHKKHEHKMTRMLSSTQQEEEENTTDPPNPTAHSLIFPKNKSPVIRPTLISCFVIMVNGDRVHEAVAPRTSLGDEVSNQGKDGIFRDDDNNENLRDPTTSAPPTMGLSNFQQRHDFWHTLAGIAGNVLEWYDFAVFGFFSDEIGQVFFPNAKHPVVQSFAVFGGAFLFRPLGGILLGYLGDVYGRAKALRISIFLMAFPTFAM